MTYIIEEGYSIQIPTPLKAHPDIRKSKDLYFRYHNDYGHDIEKLFQLKDEFERLINRGYLKKFIANAPRREEKGKGKKKDQPEESKDQPLRMEPPSRIIHVIVGGPATEGTFQAGRKRYACSISLVTSNPAPLKCSDFIVCTEKDMEGVNFSHYDAIIIKANIGRAEVRRIFVDNGISSCTMPS